MPLCNHMLYLCKAFEPMVICLVMSSHHLITTVVQNMFQLMFGR